MYMLYCAVLSILVMSNSFNPLDYSPSYSSVYGLFQARILELVAISSSWGFSQLRDWTHISCVSCMAGGQMESLTLSHQGNPMNMCVCVCVCVCVYSMEYYLAMKLMKVGHLWQHDRLEEYCTWWNKSQKDKYCMFWLIYRIWKIKQMN